MWLFVAKPLLNIKNVINRHVLYGILCPCNQCFWVKVPFIAFIWLLVCCWYGTLKHFLILSLKIILSWKKIIPSLENITKSEKIILRWENNTKLEKR